MSLSLAVVSIVRFHSTPLSDNSTHEILNVGEKICKIRHQWLYYKKHSTEINQMHLRNAVTQLHNIKFIQIQVKNNLKIYRSLLFKYASILTIPSHF